MIHNTFHPKTLVYIIQYKSNSGKYKTTILVGKGANSTHPSGYSYKTSKYEDYLKYYTNSLIDKNAFMFPMMWHYANIIFNNSKVITI